MLQKKPKREDFHEADYFTQFFIERERDYYKAVAEFSVNELRYIYELITQDDYNPEIVPDSIKKALEAIRQTEQLT